MHLGSALIRGSQPIKAAGLIERNPRTRFLLMHLAYPWSQELLGMAFVYRNIWLDLTWSWLLSPSGFQRAFQEAVDILPDESRMMLGGDTWHAEEAYGAISGVRGLVAESLDADGEGRELRTQGCRTPGPQGVPGKREKASSSCDRVLERTLGAGPYPCRRPRKFPSRSRNQAARPVRAGQCDRVSEAVLRCNRYEFDASGLQGAYRLFGGHVVKNSWSLDIIIT